MFKKIADWWRGKGLTGEDVERILRGGRSTDGPYKRLSREQQLRTIQNNSIVFSCVTTLARAFQEAPLRVEVKNQDDIWAPTDSHVYLEPFQNNPELSESEIKQYLCSHLELTGQSFLWKWKSPDGMTREVWPVPPSWVTINKVDKISPNPAEKRVIESYTIKPSEHGNAEWTVSPDDMVYMRFIDPSNLYDGLSPIVAATRYIQMEQKAEVYKGEAVSNLSLPGIVVRTTKPLSNRQREDLRAVLRQKMGEDARGNAIIIGGEGADVDFMNPLKDFDWETYSDLNETRICSVFGVPPIVIGLWVGLKNSPWSNTGEAKSWMYKNTVKGLWDMVEVGLTRSLIPKEMNVRYSFCRDEIAELQKDIKDLTERARVLFNDGIITKHESREMIGYEAIGPDYWKSAMSTMLIPVGSEIEMDEETIPVEEQLEGAMGDLQI